MNILQISAIIVELIIAHCFIYLKINPKKFSNLTDMSIFAVTAIGITGDAIVNPPWWMLAALF